MDPYNYVVADSPDMCWYMSRTRRQFVTGLTAASIAGFAGCMGDLNSGGGSGTDEWPPDRDQVEIMVNTDEGGLIDVQARTWLPYVEEEWPDDVVGTVTNRTEADGVMLANELMNDAPLDGGMMGGARINSLLTQQIGAEQADYDVAEMEPLVAFSTDTRALQLNPRTTPVEDHFEMTWEDFQALAEEQSLTFPYSNAAQHVFGQYVRTNDPVLNEENWQFVEVAGGSEARAAVERGDVDGYFGSYVSNYSTRNDAYFTQFVFVEPDSEFYEEIADTLPEAAPTVDDPKEKTLRENDQALILNAENHPQEAAQEAVSLVKDTLMLLLPPETSEDVIGIHEEAWGAAAESEELAEEIANAFSEEDHNPLVGDPVREIVDNKIQTFLENDEIRGLIEEEIF